MESLFEKISKILRENGVDSPRMEARMIFGNVLELDYTQVSGRENYSSAQEKKMFDFVQQRISGKPLDKILGIKFFYKNEFLVDENVLSPRPDTEILVEQAIEIAQKIEAKNILDMGTGSGCILLSILEECKNMCGIGIDISSKALEIARKNRENMGLTESAILLQKSWYDADFSDIFSAYFMASPSKFTVQNGACNDKINFGLYSFITSTINFVSISLFGWFPEK